MDSLPQLGLPSEILSLATRRGNEYAWRIHDIPKVIEAARRADLVSVGGQLQFRLPDGGTCECYWVEVDTYKSVAKTLRWQDRVSQSAAIALKDFEALQSRHDFVAEIRSSFGAYLDAFTNGGGNLGDAVCFVWSVLSKKEAEANGF